MYSRNHGAIFGSLLEQLLACSPHRGISMCDATLAEPTYRIALWWVGCEVCSRGSKLELRSGVLMRARCRR